MRVKTSRFIKKEKKEKNNKVFVVDLDGTLCDIDTVFAKTAYALSYLDLTICEEFLKNREYITFENCGLLTKEDENRILSLFDVFAVWENLEPFPGVKDFFI
ncbi:MAG: hypothetical protein ACOCUI_00245 [bacterium]